MFDLDNKSKEDINLPSSIFSTEIKEEIVAKVVNWQLSNKRQGSHKVKERNEVVGSNAKIYRQKGTGRARHGSKIVDKFELKAIKTKTIKSKFEKLGIKSATFIEAGDINKNFLLSTRNLKHIDLLPVNGLNAYQILKRDDLVVSLSAVKEVVKRYSNE